MSLRSKPALFVILLAQLSACGPFVPLSYDTADPQAHIEQTIDSPEATITLEYLQLQNGYYIFDLEVINRSSYTIEVVPQNITFYASSRLFPILHNRSDDVHAVSIPNSDLLTKRVFGSRPKDIERMYHQNAKAKEAASLFFCVLGAGLIVYDQVKDSQDSRKETWIQKDEQKAAGRDLLVDVTITATKVALADAYQAREESYYLPYELLPECSVGAGSSVRGKVFIRAEGSFRYARLVVPLLEVDYVFDLKRRGVKSR